MKAKKVISVVCLALYMVMFIHTVFEHTHHHDEAFAQFTELHHHHCSQQETDQMTFDLTDKVEFYLGDMQIHDILFDFVSMMHESITILDSTPYLHNDRVPIPETEAFGKVFGLRAPPVCA